MGMRTSAFVRKPFVFPSKLIAVVNPVSSACLRPACASLELTSLLLCAAGGALITELPETLVAGTAALLVASLFRGWKIDCKNPPNPLDLAEFVELSSARDSTLASVTHKNTPRQSFFIPAR